MGWISDLQQALTVFHEKIPEVELFDSIESNIYGDFIIWANKKKYIVTHSSFKVYVFNNEKNIWEIL